MATPIPDFEFDSEASQVWSLAERIGWLREDVKQEPVNRSFKTLLLAILEAEGDTSGFFRSYVAEHYVNVDRIVQDAKLGKTWDELKVRLKNAPVASVSSRIGTSTSVQQVLEGAAQLVRETGGSEIGFVT